MEQKQLIEFFQQELKAETAASRKCLERIPESLYKYKPHEKSMELGYVALLVAEIPRWITFMIKDSLIDLESYPHFKLSTTAAMTKFYEENVAEALDSLKNITEDQLNKNFVLMQGKQKLVDDPKVKSIGEAINHWVHHRGQLTVYMRLNDIAVPSIYGPSADEKQ